MAAWSLVGGGLGTSPRLLEVGVVLLILWAIVTRDHLSANPRKVRSMVDMFVHITPIGTLGMSALAVIGSPPPDQGPHSVWLALG